MSIALACPDCASTVQVAADMAGKRAKCPECHKSLSLPSTLIELPDRTGVPDEVAERRDPDAPSSARSVLMTVLAIGATVVVVVLLCGGTTGLFAFYFWRGGNDSAEMATKVVVLAPGVNLPEGAPPRGLRVTEFEGVFRKQMQIDNTDVVYKNKNGNVNNNKRCKEYVIDLEAGRRYIIDLESRDFDAYLRLEQLNGMVIAEDDDGGGNLNSRIQFTPPATATYVIVATSLGGGFGSCTLTVRDAQFSKPR